MWWFVSFFITYNICKIFFSPSKHFPQLGQKYSERIENIIFSLSYLSLSPLCKTRVIFNKSEYRTPSICYKYLQVLFGANLLVKWLLFEKFHLLQVMNFQTKILFHSPLLLLQWFVEKLCCILVLVL